jgi:hypothetical protein
VVSGAQPDPAVRRIVESWCHSAHDRQQIASGYTDLKVGVAAQERVRAMEDGNEETPADSNGVAQNSPGC